MVFVAPQNRRYIKNRSKILSETRWNEDAKTTTKNLTKNAQHNAKIDPEPPQSTKIRTPRGENPAKNLNFNWSLGPRGADFRAAGCGFWCPRVVLLRLCLGCGFLLTLRSIQDGFWTLKTLLGSILARFGAPKSAQNRSRICLKSEQTKEAKMLKNH